jgi:hypothetical protein
MIVLGLVVNELYELAPPTAKGMIRLAARLDARFHGEEKLLLAEWEEHLDRLPGGITKLMFALGILFRVALVRQIDLMWRRIARALRRALTIAPIVLIVATGMIGTATATTNSASSFWYESTLPWPGDLDRP